MASENRKNRTASPPAGEAELQEPGREKRVEYLTARQLAELLQVSESTIHRLRRAGRIPAVALTGRLIRFNLKDVRQALRPQSAEPRDNQPEEPNLQLSFEDLLSRGE